MIRYRTVAVAAWLSLALLAGLWMCATRGDLGEKLFNTFALAIVALGGAQAGKSGWEHHVNAKAGAMPP